LGRDGAWHRTIAVLGATLVLTCGPEWEAEAGDDVEQVAWPSFTAPNPTDSDSIRIRNILLNTNKYSLTHWYRARGYQKQTGTYLDLGSNDEHRVRSAASVALALAVSLKLGIYSSSVTTVSRASADACALKLIRSLAYRHRINRAGGWGRNWQSPLWALYAGTAGWLMWDQLGARDAMYVRKMVEDEARRLIGFQAGYYRNDSDELTRRKEESAEENAWNAQFLFLAVNMMPTHRLREAWEYKAADLAVSAHARPVDRQSNNQVVGGRAIRHWLRGSNVNPDGSVTNHGIFHPDYMATAAYTASAPIWYGLRRRATPDTMFSGVDRIYETLVDKHWPQDPWDPPGGTIYMDGSARIYYPDGTDWGLERRMNYAFLDVVARHFELDGLVSEKATVWEDLHAQGQLDLQARSTNGRTYIADSEDKYASREEWVAAHAALAYLVKWIAAQNVYSRTGAFIPVVIDNQDREFKVTGPWEQDDDPADTLGYNNLYHAGGGASGSRRAQWKLKSPLPAGNYGVYAWWSAFPNQATDVPYTIFHRYGSTVVKVNQRSSGNRWNYLGTFEFDGTTNTGYVEMWNKTSTGYVVADGVMYKKI
jgi:hypothetical protein